jgi:predicted amidohydrolase
MLKDDTSKRNKAGAAKHEKFRLLAENRTNNALIAIGRIGNLSNRQLYDFEDAEVRKILRALKEAVSEVENRFASPKGKAEARFKL